jgi:hypothetical protein
VKKLVLFLLFAVLVAVAVWYAVGALPREDSVAAGPDSGPAAPSRPAAAPPLPALGPVCGGHCGTERWLVKTLSDPDRDCVSLKPVDRAVEELAALDPPARRPSQGRVKPVECRVYRVVAHMAGWDSLMRGERDRDLHLVLFGLNDPYTHLIAEIPDPACSGACRSGFGERFAGVRLALLHEVRNPDSPIGQNPDSALVVVTGVGFFDRRHHQTGVAPNGFELHPVLSIEFLPLGTPARRKVSRPGASHYVGRFAGR